MSKCFFNGKIASFKDVKININDLGLLRAYAVFDYLRTYGGKPFRLDDYLGRFRKSAGFLHMKPGYSNSQIRFFVNELLKDEKNDVGIRFLLTGGFTSDSISRKKPNFFILAEKLQPHPPHIFTNGVKLITYEFQRYLPLAKTTNYMNAIRLSEHKENQKAFDILYHKNGAVLETARNNFFIVKNGVLIAPKENVLPGITKKVILELAAKNKIAARERKVLLRELKDADEAFISGSSKGIVAVVKIDGIKIGDGKPGEMTKKLKLLFEDYVRLYHEKNK